MSTKPKISGSNPPAIPMPATGLERAGKREIKKYNEPKMYILLLITRLCRFYLASFFSPIAAQRFRQIGRTIRLRLRFCPTEEIIPGYEPCERNFCCLTARVNKYCKNGGFWRPIIKKSCLAL